jgi:uncharacterized protein (TIGR03032 family)
VIHVVGAPGSDLDIVEAAFGASRVEAGDVAAVGADPTARFVYVYRDPERALALGADADEWQATTATLLEALEGLAPDQWCVLSADALLADRAGQLRRVAQFLGVAEPAIAPLSTDVRDVAVRARQLFAAPQGALGGFESGHTSSFPQLLQELGVSVLASTYQSGRVFALRAEGERLNTHFRLFDNPMGIAARGGRLVIGTRHAVWEYHDVPAAAPRALPAGTHDACFIPRSCHVTGDVRIHDVEIAPDGQVWLVNTRFSCLATMEPDTSFVPRWRPPFVSALAAEDRCHLNGLALVDGAPGFVTAFGQTDEPGGWRETATTTGLLMDVRTNEVVADGLCMPHSPRWYDARLWVLESGKGTLATVDIATGAVQTIATLPGFTRGLDFVGPYAFVGLSQVRETLFADAPVRSMAERACGVWVVDIRTGAIVAFVRFEGAVREIFDICVLPGRRYPEIAEHNDNLVATSFVLPQAARRDVPGRTTNRANTATRIGATASAGSSDASRMRLTSSSISPMPMIIGPPVASISATMRSSSRLSPTSTPRIVTRPWSTRIEMALNATPMPNTAV